MQQSQTLRTKVEHALEGHNLPDGVWDALAAVTGFEYLTDIGWIVSEFFTPDPGTTIGDEHLAALIERWGVSIPRRYEDDLRANRKEVQPS